MESKNLVAAEKLIYDYRQCGFDERDQALCDYAIKLTIAPQRMKESDVILLRDTGLDDHQISIAAQVISYFNYINRIADGLGVDLEDWMTIDFEHWRSTKPNWRTSVA